MLLRAGSARWLFGMALITLIFGWYGVREIRDALRYGTSIRDGVEALVIAVLLLALFIFFVRREQRRRG